MILSFALIPRQQILSLLFNSLFIRIKDELVVEIPIRVKHEMPITLAIVMREDIRKINKKDYPDIKNLCK